jgi:hypothetical protein
MFQVVEAMINVLERKILISQDILHVIVDKVLRRQMILKVFRFDF